MCGILGLWNNDQNITKAVATLKPRGEDGTLFWDGNKLTETIPQSSTIIGHCLHAIVNKVPQPLVGKGVLTANCEIYNWKELAKQNNIEAQNDADLLLQLLDNIDITTQEEVHNLLDKLDGVFAVIYQRNNNIIFFRDYLGIKPLWFSHKVGLAIASEKKVLEQTTITNIQEINPPEIYNYNTQTQELTTSTREFYKPLPLKNNEKELTNQLKELVIQAIQKRIPSQDIKVGILLSGGVDSTIIAKVCQDLNIETICYTAVVDDGNKEAHDLTAAKEVTQAYNFNHKIIALKPEDVEELAKESISLIEETDAVKIAVAIPFLACTKQAKEDGCKVLFSGLGAEELFAGYKRHKDATNINEECIAGLMQLHTRDLYRDDVLTMRNGVELRLPFLDKKLIKFSLNLPSELKIKDDIQKYLLRKAGQELGLEESHAFRPKKAAQYGSKVDKILKKIANKKGLTRKEYLNQL